MLVDIAICEYRDNCRVFCSKSDKNCASAPARTESDARRLKWLASSAARKSKSDLQRDPGVRQRIISRRDHYPPAPLLHALVQMEYFGASEKTLSQTNYLKIDSHQFRQVELDPRGES